MRCFVVACLLATAVYADVSHLTGYTYERGSGHGGHSSHGVGSVGDSGSASFSGSSGGSGSGSSFGLNGGATHFGGNGAAGSFGGSIGSSGFGGSLGSTSGSASFGGSGIGSSLGGSIGAGFNTGFTSGAHHHHHVEEQPAEVEFVKEFYTFDAPEEDYNEDDSLQRAKESLKKNLQVLFIKTPENRAIEHAAISLAKTASESNTAIYILQKQPDVSAFSNQLNLIHTHNARKPEVHFVKYRTDEDAANAQHSIQAQYETLGGSSVHKHGGVPEILNYASNYAPGFGGHQISTGGQRTYHTGAIIAPSSGSSISTSHTSGSHTVSGGSHIVSGGSIGGSIAAPSQTYLPAQK